MQPGESGLISITLQERLNSAVYQALHSLEKPEPLRLSQWADEHFYLTPESSNIEGPWQTLPYQKAPMNAISNDDIGIVDWMKSARVGYTKILCAAIGYFAEHKKRNQVLWQPTDSDRDDFVKDEIDPMIREVPAIKNVLKADPEKKSKFNTLSKKMFYGSTLDLKGGKAARNYRRMSKDVCMYDELDGFDPDIEGEGAPTSLGDVRNENSSFPKSIRGSTPKTKDQSQIEGSLLQADMVFYRHVPCPDCGELQKLRWANIQWVEKNAKTAKYACIECGVLIDYSHYPDMDAQGVWKTDDGKYIDEEDFFRDINDNVIEAPYHIGFHIWAAYSYFNTWTQLVDEFLKAKARKDRGDIGPLKSFINTKLGETWEDEGETLDEVGLMNRREPYTHESVPSEVLLLTCGVDIQQDRIELEVMGWLEHDENYGIEYAVIWGDPTQPAPWDDLDTILMKIYRTEDGREMPISMTCIDTGYLATTCYEWIRKRQSRRIYGTKGVPGEGRPILSAPSKKKTGRNPIPIKLYTIGTDSAKTLVYANLRIYQPGPGYSHFPSTYSETFFDQLTAEKCVTRYRRGFPHREWDKVKLRNEALDIRVLNLAAKLLFNPQYETLRRKTSQPIAAKPARQAQQKKGFVKRKEGSFFKRR